MLQIAAGLEIAATKAIRCKELYEEIAERTQEIAKSCVSAMERAQIDIEDFGFSYKNGRWNDYLMYEGDQLDGWRLYTGGYDGGDFNYWIPPTSKDAIFSCAKAIENGLIDGIIAYIEKITKSRTDLLQNLNEVETPE